MAMNPPDGGWGWAVVLSSFVNFMIIDGVIYTFGIFFPKFLSHFGESKGKTQILNSVLNGTLLIEGPLVGALVKKYGARRVVMIGGLVSSVGIFLSTFSLNLDMMIVLYGVVGGSGFALIYLPALVMVSMYFDKKRALATGIAVCGSGVGGLVFAPIYEFLLDIYGWQGTVWIMAAFVLNSVVFGTSYRPIGERTSGREKTASENTSEESANTSHSNSSSDCFSFCFSLIDSFDFSLLKSPVFILYGISTLLAMTGYTIPFNFLPSQAIDINLSTDDSAFLISIIGISNTVTRVLIGYVSDKSFTDTVLINNTALLIGGLATCFVSYYTTFIMMAMYSVLYGAVIGTLISLKTVILTELLGIRRLAGALGLNMIFMGVGTFVGSPIAGALSDTTGDYMVTFYFGGISLGLAGLISFPLRWIARREQRINGEMNEYSKTYSATRRESDGSLCSLNPQ